MLSEPPAATGHGSACPAIEKITPSAAVKSLLKGRMLCPAHPANIALARVC